MKSRRHKKVLQWIVCISVVMGLTGCSSKKEVTVLDSNLTESQEDLTSNKGESKDEKVEVSQEDSSDIVLGERILSDVILSEESGIYPEDFELELSMVGNEKIYYTTDGSNPLTSKTRILYETPILVKDRKNDTNFLSAIDTILYDAANMNVNSAGSGFASKLREKPSNEAVDKCTVIRVVAMDQENNYSSVSSNTYFVGSMTDHILGIEESSGAAGQWLAIISLSMDYGDLFDEETGIYVKGKIFEEALAEFLTGDEKLTAETARQLEANYKQRGREWERNVHIDFFESDGTTTTRVLSQDGGIRIQGNYSRSDLQKGFRLYARDAYGTKNFKYPIFGEDLKDDQGNTIAKFKTLVLRNGGNTAFTTKFSDTYWQSLLKDQNCDTQTSRPCVVYLNGEYWGLYILQEDYTEEYFENTHGVNKEDVILYKGDAEKLALGYKLDLGKLPEGETRESYYFEELITFFQNHLDLTREEDYDEFAKLVDVESVLDYFAVQIWINNKWDWPGKNWSMWRTINVDESNHYSDGRWRFVFYDIEFGGVMGKNEANANTIKEGNYKANGMLDKDTDNPAVLTYVYLMTNEKFRDAFAVKLKSLSDKEFNKETAIELLDSYKDTYEPLYEQFFNRYPGTGSKENSIDGGYASYRCIKEFLEARPNYIAPMLKFVDDFYLSEDNN